MNIHISTGPRRRQPQWGDKKMIGGALHERQWKRVLGGYQVSNGRHLWDWVKIEEPFAECKPPLAGRNIAPVDSAAAKALFGYALKFQLVTDIAQKKYHLGCICGVSRGIVHFDTALAVPVHQIYQMKRVL